MKRNATPFLSVETRERNASSPLPSPALHKLRQEEAGRGSLMLQRLMDHPHVRNAALARQRQSESAIRASPLST